MESPWVQNQFTSWNFNKFNIDIKKAVKKYSKLSGILQHFCMKSLQEELKFLWETQSEMIEHHKHTELKPFCSQQFQEISKPDFSLKIKQKIKWTDEKGSATSVVQLISPDVRVRGIRFVSLPILLEVVSCCRTERVTCSLSSWPTFFFLLR